MIGICVLVIIIIIIVILANSSSEIDNLFEDSSKRAGRRGEVVATGIIKSVFKEGDHLLTNVKIAYDERHTELDNVIINKYGIFIIEVKNYVGKLYGKEDDYEWEKVKTTDSGNTYEKVVVNPIKQVKRETYILAKYLEQYGYDVWIEGRAFLIYDNCPFECQLVLHNKSDIERLIHTFGRNGLNVKTVDGIYTLLSENCNFKI